MIGSVFREMTGADLEMVRNWRNEENVRKFMYTQHEISIEEHQNWWNNISKNPSNIQLIFEYKGIASAVVSFTKVNRKNKSATWAFYLSKDAKKGIGSLVEFEALEYVFNYLGLYKLKCEVLGINKAVIKMHKKYGFKEEGLFINEYFNGSNFISIYRLAIFNTEWQEVKKIMS